MLTVCRHALEAWRQTCGDLGVEHSEADQLAEEVQGGFLPLDRFVVTLEAISRRAEGLILGWTVGERYEFRRLGEVGNALLSSSTLGAALQRFVEYFSLVQDGAEFELWQDEGRAAIRYRILDPDIWPRQQDALFTLSVIGQLLRRAIGFDWRAVQIALEGDDPALIGELRQRTGIVGSDNADINSIRFPKSALALPLVASGDAIPPDYKALNRNLVQKRRAMSVKLRVRATVYRHLGSALPDQECVATELGMSTRTLRRRLTEENSSFQQIVYGCRMQQAAHEFRQRRDISIAETALRLGYSEHSAFTRAFSRWTGVSPHRFLREQAGMRKSVQPQPQPRRQAQA